MKKKARVLPKSFMKTGEHLADTHCRSLGLTQGTEEYDEEFNEYMFNYCDEGFGLSMTPSGLIGQNPATPKVDEKYFKELKTIFGENGVLAKLKISDYEKTKYNRILRGNIVSLAHFILDAKFGLKTKGKNGKASDFDFGNLQDADGKESEERKNTVIQNQYMRMYLVIMITRALEKVMSLDDINDAEILSEVFKDGWKTNPYEKLRGTEQRIKFVKHYYNSGKLKQNPVITNIVSTNIKNNHNEVAHHNKSKVAYFVKSVGLWFDKLKIDEIIEKATKNGKIQSSSLTFKNEEEKRKFKEDLLVNHNVDEHNAMKADMRVPVIFGSRMKRDKNNKVVLDNFVITGADQMLKAMMKGIPVESYVFNVSETKKLVKLTNKTKSNLNSFNL